MSKRSIRNLLQVIVALLLILPPLAAPLSVAASGPTNIEVTKTIVTNPGGSGYTVIAGATVRFRIVVENTAANGAGTLGDAEDVVVYDVMPPGFELVPGPNSPSVANTYVEVSPGVYRFELGTIAATDDVDFEFDVKIAPDLVADKGGVYAFDNTATAIVRSLGADDTDEMDNTYNLHLTVIENVRGVYVTKIDANPGDPSIAGAANEYRVGVVNPGPSSAREVTLVDTFDPDEEFLSVEFLNGSGICSYIASTHQLNCNLGVVDPSERVEQGGAYVPSVAMIIHTLIDSSVADDSLLRNDVAISWLQNEMPGGDDVLTDADFWESHVLRDNMLTVEKQSMPNPVTAGETLFYIITVTNDGPSDAEWVRLQDVLPAGVTFVSAADNGEWTQTTPGVQYDLNRPLPAGESVSLVLEVETASSLYLSTAPGHMITNTARARTPEMAEDNLGWSATAEDTFVAEEADLHIVKVGKPDGEVLAGEELEYTIFIYNLGPSDARNVTLLDDIVSFEGINILDTNWAELPSGAGGTIDDLNDKISFTLNVIPAGERAVLEVLVTSDDAVDVNNLVEVSADTPDPDTTNNFDETMHEFVAVANLRLAKNLVSGGAPPVAGTNITFQYDVENLGPSEATNVILKEYIPDGLTYVSSTGPDCSLVGNVLTCAYGNIPAGATWSGLNITFAIDPAFQPDKVLLNTAEVMSDVLDPVKRNNVDTWVGTVTTLANLNVSKTCSLQVNAGEAIESVIVLTNAGPSVARDAFIVDDVDAAVTVTSIQVIDGPATCSLDMLNGLVYCEVGDMAVGEMVVVSVSGVLDSGYTLPVVTDVARAGSFTGDPAPQQPVVCSTDVRQLANLTISKESSPSTVVAGDKVYYQVVVTNQGPSDATNVQVSDVLPAGVTFVAMADNGEWIEVMPGSGWMLPSLPAGQSAGFSIEAQTASDLYITELADDMLVTNNTCVSADQGALVCTAEDTYIAESADLLIKKVGKPDDTVLAGETLAYTIQVYNLGQSDARQVRVFDDILNNVGETFAIISANPAPTQQPDGTWVFGWAVIPAGAVREISIELVANEDQDINNLVHLSAATPDPNMANNDAMVMTEVIAVADLSITKIAPLPILVAGAPATFVLRVTNNGPSTADNVVVKEYIPRGVELISIVSPWGESWMGGTPGNVFDPAIINLGTMEPGQTANILVTVFISPDFAAAILPDAIGWLINDAEVSSDTLDLNNANNVDHAVIAVLTVADLEVLKGEMPDPTIAGTIMEWPIVVTNYGPSVAQNVQLIDPLDPRLEFIEMSMVSGEAQCQLVWSLNMVTCELGDMDPGETVVMLMRTHVRPDVEDGAVIYNTAYVQSRMLFALNAPEQFIGYPFTFDLNQGNNQATDSGTVHRQSWLKVTKESVPNPVLAGDKLYYEITVCNEGPSIATNISLTDYFPWLTDYINYTGPEWRLDSFQPAGDFNPPTGVWRTDRWLWPGECSSFVVEVLVRSEAAAWDWPQMTPDTQVVDPYGSEVLGNQACAAWAEAPWYEDSEFGPMQAISCVGEETFVDEEADLMIVKIGKPDDTLLAGEPLKYTVYVYNLGISDARNVRVLDNILSIEGVEIVDPDEGGPMSAGPWQVDGVVPMEFELPWGPGGDYVLGTVAVLPAGTRVGYEMIVMWPEAVDVNNIVHVESDTPDPDWSNNDDETMHEILAKADLGINKYPIDGSWIAGQNGVFEIAVWNGGPSMAENVVVTDVLPADVEVAQVTFSGWVPDPFHPFSVNTGTPGDPADPMVVALGDLPAGESVQIQVHLHIDNDYPMNPSWDDNGKMWNDATVKSDVFDPWKGDNQATVFMPIGSMADLEIEKTAAPAPVVVAGESLEYAYQVTNHGSSTALDVIMYDYLPLDDVDFVEAVAVLGDSNCTFSPEFGLVGCELGDIEPGEVVGVLVRAVVKADRPEGEPVDNWATVQSLRTPDPNGGNNGDGTTVNVHRVANVEITKRSWPEPVLAGDKLYYEITATNHGPSQATGIVVQDFWNVAQLSLLNWTGPEWSQTDGNEWTLNRSLMPGESSSFVLEFMVSAAAANESGSYVLDNGACANWAEEPSEWCSLVEQTFVDEEADLYIVKVGKPDGEVLAGEPLEYTTWVYNLGLSDARNVLVRDNILSIEGVVITEAYVIEGPAALNWAPGNMYVEATASVLPAGTRMGWKIVVEWPEGVDVNNVVHVDSDTPDPDMSNNDAATMHEIIPVSDLNISKWASEVGYAGETITYHLRVANAGPSTAENVVVKDNIPAGLTITSVTPSYGSYTEGVEGDPNAPMVFSLGNLSDEATWEATIVCAIAPDFSGVLSNDATVASDVLDPDQADNRDNAVAVIMTSADLIITKDEDPDPVYAGNMVDWTLVITNAGPSMATQVGVADYLPAEVEFVSGEVFAGEANITFSQEYGNLVVAEIGDLLPGEQVGIILHTKVKSDTDEGYIVNWAMVQSDPLEPGQGTPDPNESNNVATSSTMVEKAVDLVVTKTDDPDPVIAGADLYYTITVANQGPSDATNIVVNDVFSADVTYQNWTGSNDFSMTGPGEWSLDYLAAGESKSFMVHVVVNADTVSKVDEVTVISNEVTVTSDEMDLDAANNTYTEDTFVNEAADLYVVKIGKPDNTVRAGDDLTYTVYIYNLGLSDARDVVLTDNLLSDGQFSDPVVVGGLYDCDVDGGEIVCTIDVHPVGVRAEIQITVTADEEVDINNWTCVASATPDPDADNNCALVMTSVVPVSDLSISKSVVHGPDNGDTEWYAGQEVTFEITVANDGPSTAENVVITDYLPAFVTVVGVDPDVAYTAGVPGDPNAPMIIPVGTLASGEEWTVEITLLIDASYPFDLALGGEYLTNDAMVTSDVLDDDLSNNRDSAAIMVEFESRLMVEKIATPETVQAGETVVYTLNVWNEGPSTAYNVLVMDVFDSDYLTMVDYAIGNGTGTCLYVAAESAVLCNVGDMAPNDGRIISLTFLVSADTPDGMELVNTVDVSAESSDEQASDDVTITVVNNADLELTKTADKLEVNAGQQITYTISVVNNGPTNAGDVQVTDELPEGVTYINDDLGGCNLDEDELECELGNIAAGQSVTFKVLVSVDADTVEDVCNWAAVTARTADLDESNNEDEVCTVVNGHADLRVIKFGKPEGEVRAGDELTYTILVDNLGTGVAHSVTLVDSMFSNGAFELVSVTSSLEVNEDLETLVGEFTKSGSFTLTLADDLPITLGGAPWLITVVVVANDDQVINNCAVVDGADFDPNLANNEACAEHEITNVADLSVTKTAEGEVQVMGAEGGVVSMQEDAVTAGRFLFYTLTVMNEGPSLAENVVVIDHLPAGVVFIESDVPADLSQLPGKLIWNLGDKASGHGEIIQVKVLVPAHVSEGTVLRNTVVVMSDIFDDNNQNNSASNETYVGAAADIIVSKTSMPETALFGNGIEYSIMIKNLGPSDAGLVHITDFIPDEIDGEQWKYTIDDGMTFTEGWLDVNTWIDMPVGAMVQLMISGVVNTYWPFANTACAVSVAVDDPMHENCSTAENVQMLVFKPIEMRGLDVTSHAPDLTVSKIVATESYVELTISNIGDRPLLEPFWVDLYINPNPAPTGVNQTWEALCDAGQGWAWKVTGDNGLPLLPGESFILVVDIEDSATIFPLIPGTQVYAQADSWNPDTDWGMVLEQDEKLSLPYNNIRWATRSDWQYPPATRDEGSVIRGAETFGAADDGLPARP